MTWFLTLVWRSDLKGQEFYRVYRTLEFFKEKPPAARGFPFSSARLLK